MPIRHTNSANSSTPATPRTYGMAAPTPTVPWLAKRPTSWATISGAM